jgi:mono/diheme cytochrome c family protein
MSHRSPFNLPLLAGLILVVSAGRFTVGAQKAPAKAPAKRAAAKPAVASAPIDGSKMFSITCAACHQISGEGLEEKYPPLVGSEWVTGSDARMVRIILQGMSGPVDVAGQAFDGAMPAWGSVLKDPEIAAIATYVRSAWGNKAAPITAATVAAIRTATSSRKTPWTAPEIAQVPALLK